jgi:cytochrome c-type biogenesis protein CcmH
VIRFWNRKSKSPLPPFSKGGNSTAFSRQSNSDGFLHPNISGLTSLFSKRKNNRLPATSEKKARRLSSPFEKVGPRGICFSLFLLLGKNNTNSPAASAQAAPRLSSPFGKGGSRGICLALFLLLSMLAFPAFAQRATDPAPLQFNDTAEETRFHELVSELRCVMCQNQSLADSNAQIAVDLRREVLDLMREGRSDPEVRDFLVARYGEFVLYRPRVSGTTWLLWFGPLLFALGGGVVVWRLLRRGRNAPPPGDDETQEW